MIDQKKVKEQMKVRKEIQKKKTARLKEEERLKKLKEQEEQTKGRILHLDYPETILTMLKRLKRIDPWKGVGAKDPWNAVLIVWFKMRQMGMEPTRIKTTAKHAWVEFKHDGKWWIFDPSTVRLTHLGEPVKRAVGAKEDEYRTLARTFETLDEYLRAHDKKVDLDIDEAKILATEDYGLGTVLKMNYH